MTFEEYIQLHPEARGRVEAWRSQRATSNADGGEGAAVPEQLPAPQAEPQAQQPCAHCAGFLDFLNREYRVIALSMMALLVLFSFIHLIKKH